MKTLKLRPPMPPATTEADIQSALMRRLRRAGWLVVRVNSGAFKTARGDFFRAYTVQGLLDSRGQPSAKGFPDVLALRGTIGNDGAVCVQARLFETKKSGGTLSEGQAKFREFAASHGVAVEVVEGVAGLEAVQVEHSTFEYSKVAQEI